MLSYCCTNYAYISGSRRFCSRQKSLINKLSCIASWPEPRCLSECRSFLGIASYYKNFVENFLEIARPFYELTSKGTPFVWNASCREAFETLKIRLCSAPVVFLMVDASTHGVSTRMKDCVQLDMLADCSTPQ